MSEIRIRRICLVGHDLDRIQNQIEAVFGVGMPHHGHLGQRPGCGPHGEGTRCV